MTWLGYPVVAEKNNDTESERERGRDDDDDGYEEKKVLRNKKER